MITVLAGGVGAAKFLDGLRNVMPADDITVIVNTGDDAIFHGLHVSPDIDTVVYTLANLVDRERGWGVGGDTFECLAALRRLGSDASWFNLGDRDLAMHLERTKRLGEGVSLSEITQELSKALGVGCRILPMSNDLAPTRLNTPLGLLPFQDYFVKLRQEPEVLTVDLSKAEAATPAPGVLDAIENAEVIILAPSNPFISIGPILAVKGVREALRKTKAPVAAISPIVGGKALKGPADKMLRSLGFNASAEAVANLYRDFVNIFVIDSEDAGLHSSIEALGMKVLVTQSIMNSDLARLKLAQAVLKASRELA